MGCCSSSDETDVNVQNELDTDRLAALRIHKLLLLGAGNSGKSTFMKQLTSIHGKPMTSREKLAKAQQIQDGIVQQMYHVICAYEYETGDTDYDEFDNKIKEHINTFQNLHSEAQLTPELAQVVKELWAHPLIKKTYEERKSLTIVDSCKYFFDNVERIAADGYEPTEQDHLLARSKTTGVVCNEFIIEQNQFAVYDVGGQRSERSKWINCFDSVDAVLFVASLSCYDQNLHEDDSKNAMAESLELFEETINNHHFKHTGFILFLNKSDLFSEKIQRRTEETQLRTWFADYTGPDYDFKAGVDFILELYRSMSMYSEEARPIFHHVTCATARDNVQMVFDDVQNQVVMKSLQRNGLL